MKNVVVLKSNLFYLKLILKIKWLNWVCFYFLDVYGKIDDYFMKYLKLNLNNGKFS